MILKLKVQESISASTTNSQYGYLWWRFVDGYGCRGFGGQEVNVIPHKNFISIIQATPTPSCKTYGDLHENLLNKSIL